MDDAIRLVVNADDLGLHLEIDQGILAAHREGIVTSATVLVRGSTAPRAVAAAQEQGLSLGLHLALCGGLPAAAPAEAVSRLAPLGRLRPGWPSLVSAVLAGRIPKEEICLEIRAQLSLARSLGIEPDHLDAHQHVHLLPFIRTEVERVAEGEGLAIRWPDAPPELRWAARPGPALKAALLSVLARGRNPGRVRRISAWGVFESGRLSEPELLRLLRALPPGDWELICHPGWGRPRIPEAPGWRYGWEIERQALSSPQVRELVAHRRIELTTYAGLLAT